MTKITLNKMRLQNWMGVRDETYVFSDGVTDVYGDNASGKTTLFEAYRSTITGKFLDDTSDFTIVKDTTNPDFHKQDHSVKIFLTRDRKSVTLERIFKQTYTKQIHTGHTTDYYKNESPMETATAFNEYIKDIAKLEEIKMVSDPLYFNELDWKEKRALLVTMAGTIENDEVLMGMKQDLADIAREILDAEKSLQEEKGRLSKLKSDLTKELDKIDPAIKEKLRDMPTETELEFKAYESALEILKKRDAGIVEKMTSVSNDKEQEILAFYEKENAITAKKQQGNQLYLALKAKWAEKVEESKSGLNTIEATLTNLRKEKISLESMLATQEKILADQNAEAVKARGKYSELKEKKFVFDSSKYMGKTCPICGKLMDDTHYDLEEIEKTELADFNTKNEAEMKALKASVEEKAEAAKPMKELIDSYKTQIQAKVEAIAEAEAKKSGEKTLEMPSAEEIKAELALKPEYISLANEIKVLEGTLGVKPEKAKNDELVAERKEIEDEVSKYTLLAGRRADKIKIQARIDELLNNQKVFGQQIAEAENIILAADAFTDSFTSVMAERVNKLFPNVEFRMFKKQMNGGIENICEMWTRPDESDPRGPRPWRNLNTARKVEAGMECIKTFNKFFDLYMPIFIDNREGAFTIPKMETQVISLHARKGQTKLLFEYDQ